ncbi:pyridoxal-dependent decarboxylase [Streptomyces sp. NPDC096097]|uniref:pyridoxal phosphate-dependent decarboxylase family protein n=1 Tax=Streptomyces sp. NPDC096097 TaxID=3155546 RepID=UPI00332F4DF5
MPDHDFPTPTPTPISTAFLPDVTAAGRDHGLLTVAPKVLRDELAAAAEWAARHLSEAQDRPVTRPMPAAHRTRLAGPSLPETGMPLGELLNFVQEAIAPYPTGNGHPAFFAWINSPPSAPGLIAELLATAVNATCGMGEHALMDLERGTVRDLAALAGLPAASGGVLTSGGSMANLLALACARTVYLTRRGSGEGEAYDRDHSRLTLYYSDQAHMSVAKAATTIGLPVHRLRPITTDAALQMDPAALRVAIETDTAAGLLPFCVVSTLGTTATGAIDPLETVADICRDHGMWHHGDGAWGGLGATVPALAPRYEGVARLDSLTVDPHKTLSVPVGCGALLLPDPAHLYTAFAHQASYLTADDRTPWPWLSHATVELTRPGTRALTLWATLQHLGRTGVTGLLVQYLDLVEQLRAKIAEHPLLELRAGGPLPVACFRVRTGAADPDAFHTRVAQHVQDAGRAYLATVTHHGETILRACVCNHQTGPEHLDLLLDEVTRAAHHLEGVTAPTLPGADGCRTA